MYFTYTLYHSTQIDYIFYPKSFSSAVSNVKVVPNEECVKPHHMVVCDFIAHTPRVKKREFLPRICTWKLWDSVNASQFQWAFKLKVMTASTSAANNAGVAAGHANLTETVLSKLKDPLLDAATEVYGLSKNHQWSPETWWWNDAIPEKHARFKAYKALKKGGKMPEAKEAETTYNGAKRFQSMLSGWRSLRQRRGICHSIPRWWWRFPYCQTDGVHKPGCCWQELCTQQCW